MKTDDWILLSALLCGCVYMGMVVYVVVGGTYHVIKPTPDVGAVSIPWKARIDPQAHGAD